MTQTSPGAARRGLFYLNFFGHENYKTEKNGENGRKQKETRSIQKNLQKTVDKHGRRVYNMQACLTG